ncbi:MAG TPA: nuclear transport factor 2 family protein [Bdellovibrionota bacterium]|nr:nuclear transport factor 2 family protein [Bdellovibrionota bacterium]
MNPESVLSEYEKGLNTHNFDNVRHLIAPDAVFWFNEGSFEGIDEIEKACNKTFNLIKNEKYWLTNKKWISSSQETVAIIYNYNWTGVINGKNESGFGRGTSILANIDNTWKIIHEHLSKQPK